MFDPEVLLVLLDGDREAVSEILAEYLVDAPRQVDLLKEDLAGGDAEAARRQAHTIKGASASIGAEAVRAAAHDVERAAFAGDIDACRGLTARLEGELERLREDLLRKEGRS